MPTATLQSDASATYTRYIPGATGSKPKSSDTTVTNHDAVIPRGKRKVDDATTTVPLEGKRHKGRKDHSTRSDLVVLSDNAHVPDTNSSHGGSGDSTRTSLKPSKRPKISSGRENDFTGADRPEDAPENARHQLILSKKDKSIKKAERLARRLAGDEEPIAGDRVEESIEVHALEPLPQPELIAKPAATDALSALPSWLSAPIRALPNYTGTFSGFNLQKHEVDYLHSRGFTRAFPIQAAVLPLLLPGPSQQLGDVLVSAATGSGKTLAYVLPMIEDISRTPTTRLRGLIIMPTRELVTQVRDICDICAAAFKGHDRRHVNVGVAVGNQSLKSEQASLIRQEQYYDPTEYARRERLANAKWETASEESDNEEEFMMYEDEAAATLPLHVARYSVNVDVLVCTPGRLVEHVKTTPGFTLNSLKWLVVDEADKLLDQSFQGWLETLMVGLADSNSVRKVLLSATISHDLGKLSALKLYRPKLVLLGASKRSPTGLDTPPRADTFTLPDTLTETAIKVEDESEKPLYLLYLIELCMKGDKTSPEDAPTIGNEDTPTSGQDDDSSESSSDDESDTTLPSSSSAAESDVDEDVVAVQDPRTSSHRVLIFTRSNENAVRLSRLLMLMRPELVRLVGTLTSTIRRSARKKTLKAFASGSMTVLIASDLVSRGLDLPDLDHVISYDLPTSLTAYVHRVGRTARAGNIGHAWTLFTKLEGRWFWNEIARNQVVQRSADTKVIRMSIPTATFTTEGREVYAAALKTLGEEAHAGLKKHGKE